jgi:hypothetical protein
MVISGEVRQAKVFGESLVLRRRLSTCLGSNKIRIDDAIANEGFNLQPHMVLYHFNLEFPLLSEQTQLKLKAAQTVPRDDEAKKGIGDWNHFHAPTPNYQEQVFLHTLVADAQDQAKVEVENPAIGLGLRLTFPQTVLPYLLEWKMMGEGLYVLGVEPTNCPVMSGRTAARQQGALPHLAAGETRNYWLELEVLELSS